MRTHAGMMSMAIVALIGIAGCGRPPQMGPDEEVFATVDALFTAVTARDEQRLGECEQRLREFKESGKLPSDAAAHLDGIMARARAGNWEPAAERLYDFMKAQRRDGPREPSRKKDRTPASTLRRDIAG